MGFLANHLEVPATTVAALYMNRWQIELLTPPSGLLAAVCLALPCFFRWIKQHLLIKHFSTTSPNAVNTQVWIAVCIYVLIAILHKESNFSGPCTELCRF